MQDRKQALQEIRSALDHIRSMPRGAVGSVQDTEGVFYKSFIRSVTISAAPTPAQAKGGKIPASHRMPLPS